jgi:Flp pilus assembly protein TadG
MMIIRGYQNPLITKEEKMSSIKIATNKREQGQSLAELAITLSFVLLLLSGVVDLGRAFFTYMALRDAAQEGALYGSVNPEANSAIKARVRNTSELVAGMIGDDDISIDITGEPCTGGQIQVRVSYDNFPLTMPFLGAFLGAQTVPISAAINDTILSPSCP